MLMNVRDIRRVILFDNRDPLPGNRSDSHCDPVHSRKRSLMIPRDARPILGIEQTAPVVRNGKQVSSGSIKTGRDQSADVKIML